MSRSAQIVLLFSLSLGLLAAAPAGAQSFGAAKEKVTLQRKLPALVHMPGDTIKVTVTSSDEDGTLPYDFQALLETELLKDDPNLREDDNPATQILCQITDYSHPNAAYTTRSAPGIAFGASGIDITRSATRTATFERITGQLNVSFQAKDASGHMLISDNISSSFDGEYDSEGNSTSHGMMGEITGKFSRAKGGAKSEDQNPPTPAELRSRLIIDAVQQVAEHLVDTNETVDAFLARKDGPLEDGDKDAETGLWERALETYETAPAFPKPQEDAYRLYNIGVAYEALAYQAEDQKAIMKYLDQAAINYGKAIDAKPDEKYFLEPQKRIETAIAHYKQLDQEQQAAARAKAEASNPSPGPAERPAGNGLTNAQIITMVKSGINDTTVIKTIHGADAVNFDLTPSGQQALKSGGVSPQVLAAMRIQAAKKPAPSAASSRKGLTNTQIIAMVKAGMDDNTIIQTIHGADAVNFDLSRDGQQQLTSSGVSPKVLAAMKTRGMRTPSANTRPVAAK
ncbi:MAG TPA: tetratricopeptide repeat protein [Terracidiphilus sp.]|jgi:tetratricopeptide (TPR) repeat protein